MTFDEWANQSSNFHYLGIHLSKTSSLECVSISFATPSFPMVGNTSNMTTISSIVKVSFQTGSSKIYFTSISKIRRRSALHNSLNIKVRENIGKNFSIVRIRHNVKFSPFSKSRSLESLKRQQFNIAKKKKTAFGVMQRLCTRLQ